MAALHQNGIPLKFDGGLFNCRIVSAHLLPTYAWQRRDYWNEVKALQERMGLVVEQQPQKQQPNCLLDVISSNLKEGLTSKAISTNNLQRC